MAELKRILGQAALAATTLTDIYTVPASTQTIVSSIFVCNRSAAARTFRISLAIGGAADTPAQYIYYDVALPKDTTFVSTTGITLNAGDKIRAYASGTNVSVNVVGVELF